MNRRFVLAGMPCRFSRAVFSGLVRTGLEPVGVILASREAPSGLNASRALGLDPAWPGFVVRSPTDSLYPWLTDLAPDLVIVACFPWRVRAQLRALAPEGWLNVHPSLLPRYRGPEPVFWAIRNGDQETGVTFHLMNDHLDTGPIVSQTTVQIGDHTIESLEYTLADRAVSLLSEILNQPTIAATPQLAIGATSAPFIEPQHLVAWNDQPLISTRRWLRALVDEYGPLQIRDRSSSNLLATIRTSQDLAPPPGSVTVTVPFSDGEFVVRDNKTVPVVPLQTLSRHPERTP